MLMQPGFPLWSSNNNISGEFGATDEDRKVSAVTKKMTKYMTILMALSGFNNFSELSSLDKEYLCRNTCAMIDILSELKAVFAATPTMRNIDKED